MWAASCAAGGCTPILANIGPGTAVVFLAFLLGMTAMFWWGARRRKRRSRTSYEFDERGRAYRIPADEDSDA
jgi:hypothetical protein